ncbi:hypothetical protein D3C73_1599990 [compost metagenome]
MRFEQLRMSLTTDLRMSRPMMDLRVILQVRQAVSVIAQAAGVEHRVGRLRVDLPGELIDERVELG